MAYTRTRNFYGHVIPSATSVHACLCGEPNCNHVHLIGRDEEGIPLFEIVLSRKVYDDVGRLFRENEG